MKRRAMMAAVCLAALVLLVWFQPFGRRVPAPAKRDTGPEAASGPSVERTTPEPLPGSAPGSARPGKWNIGMVQESMEPLPVRRVRTPSGLTRFVSLLVAAEPDPEADESPDDRPAEGEPSDLDNDHPGAYWSNLGYSSLRSVLGDLGIDADRAWIDSPTGELLVSQDTPPGGAPGGDRLLLLTPEPTPGDIDGDGSATGLDVARFLERFAARDPHADINLDGVVNQADLVEFLRQWTEGAG